MTNYCYQLQVKAVFYLFSNSTVKHDGFFENEKQKQLIDNSFRKLENIFNKKIVTLVWKFEKFYKAETYHQDYYEKNFIRYLMYKKGCQREETLKKIWN